MEQESTFMEKLSSKKIGLIVGLMCAVFVLAFCVTLFMPSEDITAHAYIDYDFTIWDGDKGEVYIKCTNCSHYWMFEMERGEDMLNFYESGDFEEWELLTPYCRHCYEGHLCGNCHKAKDDCELFCNDCSMCFDCWDLDKHCQVCGQEEELCAECLEAGSHRCEGCHSETSHCPDCGRCLYALHKSMEVDADHGLPHCTLCDEPYICTECCECFFNDRENFCDQCEMCIDCAVTASEHCVYCQGCLQCTDKCDENPGGVCLACCIAEGFHCCYCLEHVDEWCVGGSDCCHCATCAEDFGWICPGCERCQMCDGFEFCEECGLCTDCCKQAAAEAGCQCLQFCIMGSEFEDAEHMCQSCGAHFSCEGEDFCEMCGYCMECCQAYADEYGCLCGMCVEDPDFEAHLCPNCGQPSCIGGDICSDCGYCEECCLGASDDEGCTCGMCIESSDFYSSEHYCENCGEFSCNVDFCYDCELCVNCCKQNTKDIGCNHEICIKSPDWKSHYCETCERCKEDCDCEQSCCADPGGSASETHGTNVAIGTILVQPISKIRTVTGSNIYDRAENTVTFFVRAYDPHNTLQYQWYEKIEGETPNLLVDESRYLESGDETLVFVGGATTNKLTISVPCDACQKEYSYYCVITSEEDGVYETSISAKLEGRHRYEWVCLNTESHAYGCVGCGEVDEDTIAEHEIGPWHYQYYATAQYGARLVRTCNVCGGTAESRTTEPLGNHLYHTYVYQPVIETDTKGNTTSEYHEKICFCGLSEVGKELHDWDSWVITEAADEKHTGSKYRECLTCHYRETVVIAKQTHEHIYTLHSYTDGERIYKDEKYHWQYCADPDCNAIAFKEEHIFSEWEWAYAPHLDDSNGRLERKCTVCGYTESITMVKGYLAIAYTNANLKRPTFSGNKKGSWWQQSYLYSATANPPTGYYFDHWEISGGGEIKLNYYYENNIQKYYTLYDEHIEFYPVVDYGWPEDLYQLTAVCYKYDNHLIVDHGAQYMGVNAVSQDGTITVESIEEDEFGYRTMTVRLHGYKGGALEVDDIGLPCNLHIIVDKDSTIRTSGPEAILGCASGGNITISSENGAFLTIYVSNRDEETCYGIRTCHAKAWDSEKITFSGNIHMDINVKSTGSQGTAIGVFSKTWIEVLDNAQLIINAASQANPGDEKTITAIGISAGKELQLNTTGNIEIDVTDIVTGKKGQGVKARNIIVDNVGHLVINFLATIRSGYNVKPTFNPKKFVLYTTLFASDTKKCTTVEPGCEVTFTIDENVSIEVEDWVQTQDRTFLVTEDEGIFFSVTPALGYYDVHVFADGIELKPFESADGVTKSYVLYVEDASREIQISSGKKFNPYVSQPGISQTKIYYNCDAVVSFQLGDVIDAIIDHAKIGGEKALNPKFRAKMGKYSDGELVTNNFTVNRIFLQRYNEAADVFVNTDFSFVPSIVGDISFNDSAKNIGKTVRYRLMIVFDGEEYPSDEFTVTWSNDPDDTVMPTVRTVELHIKRAVAGYEGGTCVGGDAWIRLNSENEYYVYDVDINKGYACSKSTYLRTWKKEHLLKVAEFDYHTGTLTLYGNSYSYDFDGNGVKETYDLTNEILAIRASDVDGYEGGLIIDVQGDTSIGGSYEDYGFEGWYDNSNTLVKQEHNRAQESVILNNTNDGFVRIISSNAKENAPISFMLRRTGGESSLLEARDYCGIKANGNVSIEGNMQVTIFLNIDSDITSHNYLGKADRYGIYTHENVTIRGAAHLACNIPVYTTSLCLQGVSEGIHADGTVNFLDDSVVHFDCEAYMSKVHDAYYALYAGELNVVGNASFELYIGEQIISAVKANEVLIATTGEVKIRAADEATGIIAFVCNGGKVTLQNPSTFIFETISSRTIVDDASSVVFEGDFIQYHMDAHDYLMEEDSYYSGVAYTVSVSEYEDMEYYNAEYEITIKEPLPTAYLITELNDSDNCSLDVRHGDTVWYIASEPEKGFRFDGWEIVCPVAVENVVRDGLHIKFTMPDCDVTLRPRYVCTAFDEDPAYFVVKEKDSLHGELHWRADVGENLYYATLEYLDENGNWSFVYYKLSENNNEYWNLNEESDSYEAVSIGVAGMLSYRGVQKLKVDGASGEGIPLNTQYTTYRIHILCSGDSAPYNCNSEPFEIDFASGIHLFASEDNSSPSIHIPSDYIGTEYVLDLSEYIYSAAGMTYEVHLGDISGTLSTDICKATVEDNIITFARNGVHSTIFAMENFTYITATDKASGKSFRIPYELGEILDSEAYPVVVNGKRAISRNKDDILGDGGSVSYNPTTKTLTLNNANLTEIYSETTDGELLAGGYAIMSVQDITIKLVGKNTINVNQYSYCYNKPSHSAFNGKIIAIGNVYNSAKWNSYLTKSDTQSITFVGNGSLSITVKGQNSVAVRSMKKITIDGGDISINAEENGLTSENGNIIVNDGKLVINSNKKSCVDLKGGAGHFQVWGGIVNLNGGSDDYVIAMNEAGYSNSIYFDKGEIVLTTKSTTHNLSNRTLDCNSSDMLTYYREDGELVAGAPEVTYNYVKLSRNYYVWVNGERITPENLTVECGNGTATFDPETNTLTMWHATINKGISYYSGIPYAAGIYAEEPINIKFIGNCKIDLSNKDFFDADTGATYTLYGEEEQYRQIYGIHISNVLYGSHGYENATLTLTGSNCKFLGVTEGIEANGSVILDGAKITISDCMVGISTGKGLTLNAGSIRIDTCDDEYAYAIYGDIDVASYSPLSIFGCTSGDLVSLDLSTLKFAYNDRWGASYRSLWIRNETINATICHDWNDVTYVWSEDGKSLTATHVCKNDATHIETETVAVTSKVTKQSTCDTHGETTYTSGIFSNSAFVVQVRTLADVAFASHTNGTPVKENEVSATCSAEGSYDEVVYCSVCGAELSRKAKVIPIDANAHEWGEWTVTKAPTETEDGEETRVCKHNPNHKETKVIAALGLSAVEIVITEENAGAGVDVKSIFETAKAGGRPVVITIGGISIAFDSDAVNAIGSNSDVTFSMTVDDETDGEMEGTQKVLNISITGFTAGNSTVTVPFDSTIPEDCIAKVYYIDEAGNKTDMHATFEGGTVTFDTTHYSKYVIVFENNPTDASEGLSTGAIVGIVCGCVGLLGAAAAVYYFFFFKRRR